MRVKFSSEVLSLLNLVRSQLAIGQDLFVVGGAVRDGLIGRNHHDLDFCMPENPTGFAKKIAKLCHANFFVLDDERHTARILYHLPNGDLFPLDFVQFNGRNLLEDLKNRDFTINAMAFSLKDMSTVIDPMRGQSDLKKGLLRPCHHHSLMDDPVRVLRGIRLALLLNFEYVHELEILMKEASQHLSQTSSERQRDEFFKILEGPMPDVAVVHCRQFKVFDSLIPPLIEQEFVPASPPHVLPLFDHTIAVVKHFNQILEQLRTDDQSDHLAPWWMENVWASLKEFSSDLRIYFNDEITPGRSKRGLAMLGALMHDIGKPTTMEVDKDGQPHFYRHDAVGSEMAWHTARRLQLSNAESAWVQKLVLFHMRLSPWNNLIEPLSRRTLYRFFKKVDDVGVTIALLSLADRVATYGHNLSPEKWQTAVNTCKVLLSAWFDHQDTVVAPQLLLDGYDLQKEFGLKPGIKIGNLLDALAEAQAGGDISNKKEAKDFIDKQLERFG